MSEPVFTARELSQRLRSARPTLRGVGQEGASHAAAPARSSVIRGLAPPDPILLRDAPPSAAAHADDWQAARGATTSADRSHGLARVVALSALLALCFTVFLTVQAVYQAFSDAWIAPLQLSPNSREVVDLRVRDANERGARARLESELASTQAELDAIEVALRRLRALHDGYSGARTWSTEARGSQLGALQRQKHMLGAQRQLLASALSAEDDAVRRAEQNLQAGLIIAAELQRARAARERAAVALNEVALEQARVSAAIEEASREFSALTQTTAEQRERTARTASPDVLRFDDVQVDIELQLVRLEAEQRAAQARERAIRSNIDSSDRLRNELQSTPLFRAMQQQMDIAFVPYEHLEHVQPGDAVYVCSYYVFNCRVTGRVAQIFPGEVITDDPWRSLARGQYVELQMRDRKALTQRALRVRTTDERGVGAGLRATIGGWIDRLLRRSGSAIEL